MKEISVNNPFGGPVLYEDTVTSTMDASRKAAADGAPPGTVVMADFQEKGRGRQGRPWRAPPGRSLMFTVFLEYPDFSAIPPALTLRTGLAAALAVEALVPELAESVRIKWPNDLLLAPAALPAKKITGILTESDGRRVFIGIGVNVLQEDFPPELRDKAGSVLSIWKEAFPSRNLPGALAGKDAPRLFLEKILFTLHKELASPPVRGGNSWKNRLETRLYKRGEEVTFAPGGPDSQTIIRGILKGIGAQGELLIAPAESGNIASFAAGELRVYG